MKIYELGLTRGQRSPFTPPDELHTDQGDKPRGEGGDDAKKKGADKDHVAVEIDFDDLPSRLREVPVPPRNYSSLRPPTKGSAGSTASTRSRSSARSPASTSPARARSRRSSSPT